MRIINISSASLFLLLCFASSSTSVVHAEKFFTRISTFFVCTQLDPSCNADNETVAEIVDAAPDGMTLVYSNGAMQQVGFVDIRDPRSPQPDGAVDVGGETTSVAVTPDGLYVVAGVNTSPSFNDTSGLLVVVDMAKSSTTGSSGSGEQQPERAIRATIDVGGQPDSVAVSSDNRYIAVVIENERDEDLGDGAPPQLPAGFLVVVDKSDAPENPDLWTTQTVDLSSTGLLDSSIRFPEDPEPEYVAINSDNIAVVTLQENNGIVLVDLATASVVTSFSAGSVATLEQVDTVEDMDISQTGTLTDLVREPDAVTWLSNTEFFATANEGDLDGGSRGFTIYRASDGSVVYESGNALEHLTARSGHYPEQRSENKGNEPEGITFDTYGGGDDSSSSESMLFVLSERSSVVLVFTLLADDTDPSQIEFKQMLPAGAGPEGIRTIPSRNLVVVASEVDERDNKLRSSIAIYQYGDGDNNDSSSVPAYPTLWSADRDDGTPIPFSALSGLASPDAPGLVPETTNSTTLYTVEDSFFASTRILTIDVGTFPYLVEAEMEIMDTNDTLAGVAPAGVVNDDKTVNLDAEGIAISYKGGFWVCHEGAGTVDDPERPVETPNLLFKLTEEGVIEKVVQLPEDVNAMQLRFGFEGVAEQGDHVVVTFQRAWGSEANPRLGIYNTVDETWKFVFYPLDEPESQNGGWVGLGDISPLGAGRFLVLERDNQGGPDAVIKRLYSIDLGDDLSSVEEGATVEKTLVRDLVPDLLIPGGAVYEKMEGLAVNSEGEVWVNNDNDGVDDNSGEQQLIGLGAIVTVGDGDGGSPPTSAPEGTSDVSHHAFSVISAAALLLGLVIV